MFTQDGLRKLAFLDGLFGGAPKGPSYPTYNPNYQRVVDRDYSDRASTLGIGALGVAGGIGGAKALGGLVDQFGQNYADKQSYLAGQLKELNTPGSTTYNKAVRGGNGKLLYNTTTKGDGHLLWQRSNVRDGGKVRSLITEPVSIGDDASRKALIEAKKQQFNRAHKMYKTVGKWGRPAAAVAGALALPMAYNYFFGDRQR